MDPNFSVLLGNEKKDECEAEGEEDPKKRMNGVDGALIGGLVGAILLVTFFIFVVLPRFNLWRKAKGGKRLSSKHGMSERDEEMIDIYKREGMEVNTVSGRFTVRF